MSEHTPGSWMLVWNGNRLFIQPDTAGFDIAELTISSSRPARMAVANGNLMAAAPELLEALQDCVERLEAYKQKGLAFPLTVEKARIAIAKAKEQNAG